MKILVIDDDEMTIVALAETLRGEGYEVVTCLDAVEALKIITDEKIDLVICDIMMPAISGFTLLSMMKNFYFSKIPLILMSGYGAERELTKESETLGAYSFISKPIDYPELFRLIEDIATAVPNTK